MKVNKVERDGIRKASKLRLFLLFEGHKLDRVCRMYCRRTGREVLTWWAKSGATTSPLRGAKGNCPTLDAAIEEAGGLALGLGSPQGSGPARK